MTKSIPTCKVGDVLTLKVEVIQGAHGPCISLTGSIADRMKVPGHPNFQLLDTYRNLDVNYIVAVETPLRVGDRVSIKQSKPHEGPGTIMADLGNGQFMVELSSVGSKYWYRHEAAGLDLIAT